MILRALSGAGTTSLSCCARTWKWCTPPLWFRLSQRNAYVTWLILTLAFSPRHGAWPINYFIAPCMVLSPFSTFCFRFSSPQALQSTCNLLPKLPDDKVLVIDSMAYRAALLLSDLTLDRFFLWLCSLPQCFIAVGIINIWWNHCDNLHSAGIVCHHLLLIDRSVNDKLFPPTNTHILLLQ